MITTERFDFHTLPTTLSISISVYPNRFSKDSLYYINSQYMYNFCLLFCLLLFVAIRHRSRLNKLISEIT